MASLAECCEVGLSHFMSGVAVCLLLANNIHIFGKYNKQVPHFCFQTSMGLVVIFWRNLKTDPETD